MQSAPPNFTERLKRYLSDVQKQNSEAGKAFLYLEFVRDVFKQVDMDYLERLYPELEKHIQFKSKTLAVRGRSDAFLSNVIVEFKIELTNAAREQAEGELRKYVAILWSRQAKGRVAYVAVATDGLNCVVYRPRTSVPLGGEVSPDVVRLDVIDRLALSKAKPGRVFIWLDRYMLYRTLKPATAEGIVDEFGLGRSAYNDTVPMIEKAWRDVRERTLYDQWASYLRVVYGIRMESEELFIRHAYLATLSKLMAFTTISGGVLPVSDEEIIRVIDGDMFSKEWGFRNFVEEDFFSWVARSQNGVEAAHNLLERIAAYDLRAIDEDVLKGLYEGLLDKRERHQLGEVYTPDWLAEYMVSKTLNIDPHKSVLDPACGSGTFLAAAIRAKKAAFPSMQPQELIDHIVESVTGMDVHPLAVLMARTTYILSMGTDLLELRTGPVAIPVYMADSIRLPEEEEQTTLEGVRCTSVDAEGVKLRIPNVLLKSPSLSDAAIEVARDYAKLISKGEKVAEDAILNSLRTRSAALERLLAKTEGAGLPTLILMLARDMANLIERKKDTIWAFILKNKYKTSYLRERRVQLLLGNPPWLPYRDVQSADYQRFLKQMIIETHGLLDKSDAEVITLMELATLFLVRCADLYLAEDGVVAFVLPRSVFSADQHDNFRKLKFNPKLKILQILDLEDVKPLFRVPSCVVIACKEK